MTARTIAFLTDFGTDDPYVGMMKSVVLSLSAHLPPSERPTLLDLTHGISPQNVRAGGFWLEVSRPYLPPRTIVVAVVDPGVGSARRALLVEAHGHLFIGPDNGLFAEVARDIRATTALDRESVDLAANARGFSMPRVGRTFDGRDLFAKAAALVASGVAPSTLGEAIDPLSLARLPENLPTDVIEIVVVDHFGNLISDRKWPSEEDPRVSFGGSVLRWVETYAAAEAGELVALRSSAGTLEIALRNGNAARTTGLGVGARLSIHSKSA